jgi:hypothetical protein
MTLDTATAANLPHQFGTGRAGDAAVVAPLAPTGVVVGAGGRLGIARRLRAPGVDVWRRLARHVRSVRTGAVVAGLTLVWLGQVGEGPRDRERHDLAELGGDAAMASTGTRSSAGARHRATRVPNTPRLCVPPAPHGEEFE